MWLPVDSLCFSLCIFDFDFWFCVKSLLGGSSVLQGRGVLGGRRFLRAFDDTKGGLVLHVIEFIPSLSLPALIDIVFLVLFFYFLFNTKPGQKQG